MTVRKTKLLQVIGEQVEAVGQDDRPADYRKALKEHLAHIVGLEATHQESAIQIQKKVTDQVQALGRYLADQQQEQ